MHLHMMMFGLAGGILHATIIAVVAFFVLFAASKADGVVRLLGNILGLWLIILAVLGLVMTGLFLVRHHGDKDHMHGLWVMHWGGPPPANAPAPQPSAAPASPASSVPATPAPAAPAKH